MLLTKFNLKSFNHLRNLFIIFNGINGIFFTINYMKYEYLCINEDMSIDESSWRTINLPVDQGGSIKPYVYEGDLYVICNNEIFGYNPTLKSNVFRVVKSNVNFPTYARIIYIFDVPYLVYKYGNVYAHNLITETTITVRSDLDLISKFINVQNNDRLIELINDSNYFLTKVYKNNILFNSKYINYPNIVYCIDTETFKEMSGLVYTIVSDKYVINENANTGDFIISTLL